MVDLDEQKATGRRVTVSGGTFFRIAGGAIAEDWDAWNLLSLLRQLRASGS